MAKKDKKEKNAPEFKHYCCRCATRKLCADFEGRPIESTDKHVLYQFNEDEWRDSIAKSLGVQEIKHKIQPDKKLLIYCGVCKHEPGEEQ